MNERKLSRCTASSGTRFSRTSPSRRCRDAAPRELRWRVEDLACMAASRCHRRRRRGKAPRCACWPRRSRRCARSWSAKSHGRRAGSPTSTARSATSSASRLAAQPLGRRPRRVRAKWQAHIQQTLSAPCWSSTKRRRCGAACSTSCGCSARPSSTPALIVTAILAAIAGSRKAAHAETCCPLGSRIADAAGARVAPPRCARHDAAARLATAGNATLMTAELNARCASTRPATTAC